MAQIHKFITKYGLILILSYLISHVWFYLVSMLFPVSLMDHYLWMALPNYIHYFLQVVICVLLLIDVRKYGIKFYLVPLIGLFYPLLGVVSFLILYIYKSSNEQIELKK